MSVDKLVDSTQLDSDLTSVANAIRTKGGTSSQMSFPSGFVSAIENIHTGSTPTGTKEISITENGTTTEDVTDYAYAEIEVAVPASAVDSGTKNITANGTGQDVVGYAAVDVAVPNTYAAGDEGKVVSSGALVSQTSGSTTSNGTVDTTLINSLSVSVPASAVVSGTLTVDSSGTKDVTNYQYASVPAGTAGTPTATKGTVSNHAITVTPSVTNSAGWVGSETKTGTAVTVQASELDSGTKSITANGTNQDVVGYAAVDVAVPNSYSAGDEGKVVDDGALVSQTAHADVTPTTSDQTINTTTNNSIKVKGDADLVAGNIKKDVEIFGVTGSYEGSGGGSQGLDANLDGTLTSITSNVTSVRDYAIRSLSSLQSITLNNATSIGGASFWGCSNLASVSAPACTLIKSGAFQNCYSLDIDIKTAFPLLTKVEGDVFRDSGLTRFVSYTVNYIGSNSLRTRNASLTLLCIPNGGIRAACYGMNNLTTADMMTGWQNDLGTVRAVASQTFYNCTSIETLILRSDTLVGLQDINAFTGTPFASGGTGGDIYIPKTLYDALGTGTNDYKAASNWSTINGYGTITWHAIEGSYYETHYADGTLIPTT